MAQHEAKEGGGYNLVPKGKFTLETTQLFQKDVNNKQFASSYFTPKFPKAGSLNAKEFVLNANGTLKQIKFEVVAPARDAKGNLDPEEEYVANAK
jgi:hypothetical protein